jgi:hypothetical protein
MVTGEPGDRKRSRRVREGALEKGRKAPRQRPTSAAITDLIAHRRRCYQGVPGARTVIEGQVHEWCEQVLVEVVLATRSSTWTLEQLDALLSPISLTAALLPRHCCMRSSRSDSRRSSEPHEDDRNHNYLDLGTDGHHARLTLVTGWPERASRSTPPRPRA